MRILWLLAAALVATAVVTFFAMDDAKVTMPFLMAGVSLNMIVQYRERHR